MKRFSFLPALLLSTTLLTAQPDTRSIGKVTYTQLANTSAEADRNGQATLLFNNSRSLYTHDSAPKRDSSYSNADFVSANTFGDYEGFPILKLHGEGRLFSKIACPSLSRNHCIVSDTFGSIAWALKPERKQFGQFACLRAVGHFRGRDYEAWYAPEIPVPSGPYKLGGLPGLILEARSLDGSVSFLFSSLEISENTQGEIKMPDGKDIQKTIKQYWDDIDDKNNKFIEMAKAKGVEMFISKIESIELNWEN